MSKCEIKKIEKWFSTNKGFNDKEKSNIRNINDLSSLNVDDLGLLNVAIDERSEPIINIESIPGTSMGSSRKLAIIFTCNICQTRSAKKFTERAYTHGVVLVRCPNCESLHLIADNLGYFTEGGWNVEQLKRISEKENVSISSKDDVLEVSLDATEINTK